MTVKGFDIFTFSRLKVKSWLPPLQKMMLNGKKTKTTKQQTELMRKNVFYLNR